MDEIILDMDEYLPLRDVVFHALRKAILTGKLKPGERLMEIHLAQQLGEGLLDIIRQKGSLADFVKLIFESTGYVSREELKNIEGPERDEQRSGRLAVGDLFNDLAVQGVSAEAHRKEREDRGQSEAHEAELVRHQTDEHDHVDVAVDRLRVGPGRENDDAEHHLNQLV